MIHDILTMQFGSDRKSVQDIINGLYIDGYVSVLEVEKELTFGGWGKNYLDMYIEILSTSTYNRMRKNIPTRIRKKTENDYFRDNDLRKYIDNCVIIEFKTRGSKRYRFSIGNTIKQINRYQRKTYSALSMEHRPSIVIPIIMLPDSLYGYTEDNMIQFFENFTNSNILYKTYFLRSKSSSKYIAFEDRYGKQSRQTPKRDAVKILERYRNMDILCPIF